MRVLVAGASGVIGSRVVRLLVAQGHMVFGTSRGADRTREIEASGAVGVVMNALDPGETAEAIATVMPEVVVHQLTALSDFDFVENGRLRIDGTRNLVAACHAAGVDRMVAQSISWAYEPGPGAATEGEPLARDPETTAPSYPSIEALEAGVRELHRGTVLRYGLFYGPGTWYAPGGVMAQAARSGSVLATSAWTSFVHVDDAAAATVMALDWPPGTYNVVDDDPTHVDEWGSIYIEGMGGRPTSVGARAEGRAASNAKARTLGWMPEHPTWRTALVGSAH